MKIINDPVYGFIDIEYHVHLKIIDHPYFQRLRRIKQLGMANLVYPGAQHTRLHHSIGAMHLVSEALKTLAYKGTFITEEEQIALMSAMLMHDLGHGPFSHVLESTIVSGISHEEISNLLMQHINAEMHGELDLTLRMFRGECRPFLHQLISSQLDMDRLDYLKRDSFYTGVTEGNIGASRIIKMLDVCNDNLAFESKGIYSLEKFLMARRLMYWQVYLHKTVIASERMLVSILRRAKYLAQNGTHLFAAPHLLYFIENDVQQQHFKEQATIDNFCLLDDSDVMSAIKVWESHPDKVLSTLSSWFINRRLFHLKMAFEPFSDEALADEKRLVASQLGISLDEADYFVMTGSVSSHTYKPGKDKINIKYPGDSCVDISEVSEVNLEFLDTRDARCYLCTPRI